MAIEVVSFRIHDFMSIIDSGECFLSGDNITVLAGQNEAGKTAVLKALRDFGRIAKATPLTKDYLPDNRDEILPLVSVKYRVSVFTEYQKQLEGEELHFPDSVFKFLEADREVWIHRDLRSGKLYIDDDEILALWSDELRESASPEGVTEDPDEEGEGEEGESDDSQTEVDGPERLAWFLKSYGPPFIYFDSFEDSLPQEVTIAEARDNKYSHYRIVQDFIGLSGLDLKEVEDLALDPKALENYLKRRSTEITGDFLDYWQQAGVSKITLKVQHRRDEEGVLRLAFFVSNGSLQYPEQRSKGFLWFLSFYLRLSTYTGSAVLLIDEPGSYLHAKAQRDVLDLFEKRVSISNEIIYATHSIFLMPGDRIHRIRIVINDSTKGTRVLDRLTHPDLRGGQYADTLSPIVEAIGIDFRSVMGLRRKQNNLIVEGMSDLMYLSCWLGAFNHSVLKDTHIFPVAGAQTVKPLASLLIGWGERFSVLLDRDTEGLKAKLNLVSFGLEENRIIHHQDAVTIEDHFSTQDFRTLLKELDGDFTLEGREKPSEALQRQRVDKILLARTHAEMIAQGGTNILTQATRDAISRTLNRIGSALEEKG